MMLFSSADALSTALHKFTVHSGKYGISNRKKTNTNNRWLSLNFSNLLDDGRQQVNQIYLFTTKPHITFYFRTDSSRNISKFSNCTKYPHHQESSMYSPVQCEKQTKKLFLPVPTEITTWSSRCFTATNDSLGRSAVLLAALLSSPRKRKIGKLPEAFR